MTKYGDSKGAIKGTTLNSKSLNNLLIPLPPIEEQKRIVDTLEQLLLLCDDIKTIEDKLISLNTCFIKDFKDSLIKSAILGKRQVTVMDKEGQRGTAVIKWVEGGGEVPQYVRRWEGAEAWRYMRRGNSHRRA